METTDGENGTLTVLLCKITECELLCCVQDSTGHDSVTSSTADDASSAADKVTLCRLSLFVCLFVLLQMECAVSLCAIDKLHFDCLISYSILMKLWYFCN